MEQEIKRLKDFLVTINPLSDDYNKVLVNLQQLVWLNKDMNDEVETPKAEEPKPTNNIEVVVEPTPMAEPVSATVVADPEPVVTATVEAKSDYTKEEVRAILSSASKNGIQIQPIIEKYVPEGKSVKFSEVPASSYAELVKEIRNAG